jgi:pyridoxamine 5'-phosphate oxidase
LRASGLDDDPFVQFRRWFAEAEASCPRQWAEANAMTLATASRSGQVSARIVLLKDVVENGVVFFTNYRSRKALQLKQNARAALLFHWPWLGRQVRLEGAVEKIASAESDRYFASRPRKSRIGAVASPQSAVIESRRTLLNRVGELTARFKGKPVPRPAHWGGYRLVPERIEFWQAGTNRLHDRFLYRRTAGGWKRERLAP